MIRILLFILIICSLGSCSKKFDEDILAVAGLYEANIVGLSGPHLISISVDHGDDILIDAPFDGEFWYLAEARIEKKEENLKEIKIPHQRLIDGIYIEGDGIYFDYVLQLDYKMEIEGDKYDFSLIGTRL